MISVIFNKVFRQQSKGRRQSCQAKGEKSNSQTESKAEVSKTQNPTGSGHQSVKGHTILILIKDEGYLLIHDASYLSEPRWGPMFCSRSPFYLFSPALQTRYVERC